MAEGETFGDRLTLFLGYESIRTSADAASSRVRLRPDLIDADDHIDPIVLAFLVDSTPGVVCGSAALPDWVVTTDLHMHIFDMRAVGPLRADAKLVRASRVGVLGEVVLVDEGNADRVVAAGSVNHARVPMTGGLDVPMMPVGVLYRSPAEPSSPEMSLRTHAAIDVDDDGNARHTITELTRNPLDLLHGSVTTAMAMAASKQQLGKDWHVSEVVLRFVGSVRVGPARASASVLQRDYAHAVVRVDVVDEAKPDRVAAVGWVALSRDRT